MSLIAAGTAFGLLLTPIGVLYTDVGKSLPLLIQFLMYLTPVVYPMPISGWSVIIFKINPLTSLILTTRDWLTGFSPVFLYQYFLVNIMILCLLLSVWVVYRTAMPILIERMSS